MSHVHHKETKRKDNGSLRVQLMLTDETTVEQAHLGATNINAIMAKFRTTGFIAEPNGEQHYGDFSGAVEYHESCDKILEAQHAFARMPSNLRNQFGNDPGRMLDFVHDPTNLAEAQKLGLLPKAAAAAAPPEVEPTAVPGPLDIVHNGNY